MSYGREFTHSTSQGRARVKFESRAKFESGSIFLFFDCFLLFISSGCYFCLYNDMLVANRKNYNCLVYNILRYRSLEPLPLRFAVAVQSHTASLSVHEFSKKIKTCICLHLKQRFHFRGSVRKRTVKEFFISATQAPSCLRPQDTQDKM